MTSRKTKKIGVFFDGRPGHEKQTQAIISSLEKIIELETEEVDAKKRSIIHQCIRWLQYFLFFPARLPAEVADCDVLIGTGTHTHLEMLLCKRKWNIPTVTCMTPSSLLRKKFDLFFAPQHDMNVERGNVVNTIGPPFINGCKKEHDATKVLILLGGVDARSHVWDNIAVLSQVESILLSDPAKTFILSTSPRTPPESISSIAELEQKYTNVEFFPYTETAKGWVEEQYCCCRYVWVTADSISMVYEALSSGCCVGIIPVEWHDTQSKFNMSERFLVANGYVVMLDDYLKNKKFVNPLKSLNEAQRCAEILCQQIL